MLSLIPFCPDYNVINVTELENKYQVQAEVSEPTTHCLHCNHAAIVGFGRRSEVIVDTPTNGKPTHIMLSRRRYRCKLCRRTFFERVQHKDGRRQMTHRLIEYIARECQQRPFTRVADDVGVDEKTIRNIFSDCRERINKTDFRVDVVQEPL